MTDTLDASTVPVYVVDDDPAVRQALHYLLEGYGFQVAAFADGEEFLSQVDPDRPGCLILDSRMPGFSGQQVHDHLNQAQSCLAVLFLTSHGDLPMAVKAFRDGACDFHQKPINAAELVPSIERAQRTSLALCRKHQYQQRFNALTPRERQLFELVAEGMINKQIADRLCISVRTVEVHRAKMMARLGASHMADLVKIAEILKTPT